MLDFGSKLRNELTNHLIFCWKAKIRVYVVSAFSQYQASGLKFADYLVSGSEY